MKKGILGEFASMKQANIKKRKGKEKKTEETPQKECFPKKGLMDKRQRKRWNFEMEDLKTGLLGEQKRKTSKIAGK